MIIDEAYLYKYMPEAERCLMSLIPPDEELCHKFSRRFERKMRALIKYERRTPRERKFYHNLKLGFAIVAMVLLVMFGSVMSVKAYRSCVVEFFVQIFEDLTAYSVKEEKPEGVKVVPVEPDYVPEGYTVTRSVTNYSEHFVWYENSLGDEIHYNQAVIGATGRYWDTEVSVTTEAKLRKQTVNIVEENNVRTIYWKDKEYVYSILGTGNLELEELLKMARSVMKKR